MGVVAFSKINSTVVSIFTSAYVFYWPTHFPNDPLRYPPSFDSRVVLYPGVQEVRDYFAWRQADSELPTIPPLQWWLVTLMIWMASAYQQPV